jgi:Major Facilitator Superfamily.
MNIWKKNIALFLSSQIISLFGSSLVGSAMAWYITLETQSGTMLTIAMICGFLPMFFVSPFAGVWADRHNKKRLIMFSDLAIAAATLGMAISFISGYRAYWLMFAVMAFRGLGQGIQQPAVNSLVPRLVPPDKLMRINGVSSSAQSAMMLISPAAAGALMTFAPLEIIFFIDVVTAVIAVAVLALFVRAEEENKAEKPAGKAEYFKDFRLGLKYAAGHKVVALFLIFSAVMTVTSAPVAILYSLHITRLFGPAAWRLSAIDVAFSAGMTLGGLLITIWGGFKNRHTTITIGLIVSSIGTVLCGILVNFWLCVALVALIGACMPLFNTPAITVLQELVEPEYLGRVISFVSMVGSLMMPVGLLVFGPLSDVIGLDVIFIGTGALQIIISVIFMFNKTARKAGIRHRA